MKGHLSLVKRLIDLGAIIDAPENEYDERTALEHAAAIGAIDIIQLLLSRGASTDGKWRRYYVQAIALAERKGHRAAAEVLRRHRKWTAEDQDLFSTMPTANPVRHCDEDSEGSDEGTDALFVTERVIEELPNSGDDEQMIGTEPSTWDDEKMMIDMASEGASNAEEIEQMLDTNGEFLGPVPDIGLGDGMNLDDCWNPSSWIYGVDSGISDVENVVNGNGVNPDNFDERINWEGDMDFHWEGDMDFHWEGDMDFH
ncbi:hypothetical protein K449DRAFT_47484 [Hypoxylon sp. EC38]|nr:hypothetical protein K449DRAFT_47484 [Hypoxylon sp. EC38]